ncbi:hypothetical protein [Leptolyngbya sp. PCC 6406]|nr:hypothetical protein [Leptolyngbya sp. PCC 6406]
MAWCAYRLDLLAAACTRLTPYLAHSRNRTDVDRALCNLPPLTP